MLIEQAVIYRCKLGHAQGMSGFCQRCAREGRRQVTSPKDWRDLVTPGRDLIADPWPGDEFIDVDGQIVRVLGVSAAHTVVLATGWLRALKRESDWPRQLRDHQGILQEGQHRFSLNHDPISEPRPGDEVVWPLHAPDLHRVLQVNPDEVQCSCRRGFVSEQERSLCVPMAEWTSRTSAIAVDPQWTHLIDAVEPSLWRSPAPNRGRSPVDGPDRRPGVPMITQPVAVCSRCAKPAEVPMVGAALCVACQRLRFHRWPEVLDALDDLDKTLEELHQRSSELRDRLLVAQARSPSPTATPGICVGGEGPSSTPASDTVPSLAVSGVGLEASAILLSPPTNNDDSPVCAGVLVGGDGLSSEGT